MAEIIYSAQDLISIIAGTTADMETHVEELRQLDSHVGDGDLGVTVGAICKTLREYLSAPGTDDIGKLLMTCSMKTNQTAPSTFGTLLAMGFMGAAKAAMGKTDLTLADLAAIGQGAVSGMQKMSKADIGDKTLLDALIPAVNCFESNLKGQAGYEAAFNATVAAAKKGMEATTEMKAKFGRAAWHQEQSIGLQDAGATAFYFIIESFARHIVDISSRKST